MTRKRDADLLQAIFDNDPQGWQHLIERYGPTIKAVVRMVSRNYREPVTDPDIDEVVQEVFERAAQDGFQWLKALRDSSMLEPSLRVLAAWRTLGLLRSKYRVFTCSLESEAEIGGHHVATAVLARPPDRAKAPYITREDVDRLLADFLKKIGSRPTRILTSVYEFDKQYADIAAKESVPVPAVAQTLLEERKKLAAILAEAAPEAEL